METFGRLMLNLGGAGHEVGSLIRLTRSLQYLTLCATCFLLSSIPTSQGVQCCYYDPKKGMNGPECYYEKKTKDWCFVCMSPQCYILNLQHHRFAANGVAFRGRNPTLTHIQPGCMEYREEMGSMLVLDGTFCFCNDHDYCNTEIWNAKEKILQTGYRNGSTSYDINENVADRSNIARGDSWGRHNDGGPDVSKNKTETLILFILVGVMVLFVAFCCIVLNQTCCALGLCSS